MLSVAVPFIAFGLVVSFLITTRSYVLAFAFVSLVLLAMFMG